MQPKPNIRKLPASAHGGINYDEFLNAGIDPDTILDFSVNCNPFGPPPHIRDAIDAASIDRYPDSESTELTSVLATKLDINPANSIIGSGSTELIRMIAAAYFSAQDTVLIPHPTYSEYAIASRIEGSQIMEFPLLEQDHFRLNATELLPLIKKYHPKGLFLCNPNNPTGHYLAEQDVRQIVTVHSDTLVVLDEAYIAFTENTWSSVNLLRYDNVVILRSMTKDYALAGLRLGYAMAAEPVIYTLKKVRPPWNVNAVAQQAGIIALNNSDYLTECGRKIAEAKDFLVGELHGLGLTTVPSQTNFFLVKVGNAAGLRKSLLNKGFLVRDCTSFGLPDYVRLAPRTMPECRRLISAIKELMP